MIKGEVHGLFMNDENWARFGDIAVFKWHGIAFNWGIVGPLHVRKLCPSCPLYNKRCTGPLNLVGSTTLVTEEGEENNPTSELFKGASCGLKFDERTPNDFSDVTSRERVISYELEGN